MRNVSRAEGVPEVQYTKQGPEAPEQYSLLDREWQQLEQKTEQCSWQNSVIFFCCHNWASAQGFVKMQNTTGLTPV